MSREPHAARCLLAPYGLSDPLALYQRRANAPLDELARLMGFPGKLRMDGSVVCSAWEEGRAAEIRDYCGTDVVNPTSSIRASSAALFAALIDTLRGGVPAPHRALASALNRA